MTLHLKHAIELVSKMPDAQQDMIAALMVSLAKGERPIGLAQGLGHVHDDFNKPLSEEELSLWYDLKPSDPLSW